MDRDLPPGGIGPTDRGGEVGRLPVDRGSRADIEVDLQPLDPEMVVHGARITIRVPVAEELLVVVQRQVGVDAERKGTVGGESRELLEPFRVHPLL